MASKVLALTEDGRITFCSAPEELRGKGRCNHIAHQKAGQTPEEFIASIENDVMVEDELKLPDQRESILNLVSQYGRTDNPDWKKVISRVPNPFNIGSETDGTYEEANMVDFKQELIERENGNVYHLVAQYEFRGRIYDCDFGEVPAVNEDGTITMDGVNWRVLPVLDKNKAGVISYNENIVIKQEDQRNIALMMPKDPDADYCIIYGINVPIKTVENFLQTGDKTGLTSGQVWALKSIDPVAYERFPDLASNLHDLKNLPADEYGDLSWRRCLRYEDIVQEQMRLQMRRMGVTFRQNLSRQQNAKNAGRLTNEEIDARYPLFYQVNLTENIKSDLVGRSNVQHSTDLNPIAALSQSQKISYTGPGGYNKDKAPYNLRMPHKSHEGLIDPMDISSGKNVGLTGTLSMGYIGEDRFIHKKDPSKTLSPSDFIPYREHDDPNRAIMAVAHMKQSCPIVGGEEPIVKTPAWDKIKGCKLGVNLRIAYVPCEGVFEDAVVISQSAAEKMTTIQTQKYEVGKSEQEDLKNLKVGQRVEMKDQVAGAKIKIGGVVKSIGKDSFEVETVYEMTSGNKLAGRHGNKSVISKVLPDNEMPKILNEETGKLEPAQVVMSPLSVSGRKNLGQVMETNEAEGYGPVLDKKHTVVLPNGKRVEATAGKQYILRLNHIAQKKLSSHADELTAKREPEGARLGEMEAILLSQNEGRLQILEYLRHQENYDSHKKLNSLLKAVGVQLTGVNWEHRKDRIEKPVVTEDSKKKKK